jgi:hypothetical protein
VLVVVEYFQNALGLSRMLTARSKEGYSRFNILHHKRLTLAQTSTNRLMTKLNGEKEHRKHPEGFTDESTSFNVFVQIDVSLRKSRA